MGDFSRDYHRLKKFCEELILDHDPDLYQFLLKGNGLTQNEGVDKRQPVLVDFDGCFSCDPRPDAPPTLTYEERYLESEIIDILFNRCFKYDDDSEWSRVAWEWSLRKDLDLPSAKVDERLKKLTDHRRYGIDEDSSQRVILYSDMAYDQDSRKDALSSWSLYSTACPQNILQSSKLSLCSVSFDKPITNLYYYIAI